MTFDYTTFDQSTFDQATDIAPSPTLMAQICLSIAPFLIWWL